MWLQIPEKVCDADWRGATGAPFGGSSSGDLEAAVHDPGVRVAGEAEGGPLFRSRHEALRPCELEVREYAIEAGPAQWKS